MFAGKRWHEPGQSVLVDRRYRYTLARSGLSWEWLTRLPLNSQGGDRGFESRMRHQLLYLKEPPGHPSWMIRGLINSGHFVAIWPISHLQVWDLSESFCRLEGLKLSGSGTTWDYSYLTTSPRPQAQSRWADTVSHASSPQTLVPALRSPLRRIRRGPRRGSPCRCTTRAPCPPPISPRLPPSLRSARPGSPSRRRGRRLLR